jgi:hypothetical protein
MKRTRKNSKQRSSSFKKHTKRLAAYSAAAAATVMTAGSANAAEVVWDIVDVTSGVDSYVEFNLITGAAHAGSNYWIVSSGSMAGDEGAMGFGEAGYADPYLYNLNASSVKFVGSFPTGTTTSTTMPTTTPSVTNTFTNTGVYLRDDSNYGVWQLGAGYAVGAGANITTESASWAGLRSSGNGALDLQWKDENDGVDDAMSRGFVGFSFKIAGADHYGWAELTIDHQTNQPRHMTVHAFGYNDVAGADATTHQCGTTGDYNCSGAVEQGDLDLVLQNWGDASPPVAAGWWSQQPGDGFVNQDDLDGVLQNWGDAFVWPAPLAAATAAVPEPSSVLLLAAGAAGLASWRRRRSNA